MSKKRLKSIYEQLIGINDTPERKALGFALGIFMGIFPGVGPVASVVCAVFLRVNKAAALMGSLLTNTWFSIVTFALAVKVGSAMTGTDWRMMSEKGKLLLKNFHWKNFGDVAFLEILKPIGIGYLVVSFVTAFIVYCVAIYFLKGKDLKR